MAQIAPSFSLLSLPCVSSNIRLLISLLKRTRFSSDSSRAAAAAYKTGIAQHKPTFVLIGRLHSLSLAIPRPLSDADPHAYRLRVLTVIDAAQNLNFGGGQFTLI